MTDQDFKMELTVLADESLVRKPRFRHRVPPSNRAAEIAAS